MLERARRMLSRDDALLLVGSGVSMWSGLPSWPRLISALADYVDRLGYNSTPVRGALRDGDLALAASYGAFQLNRAQFGAFLRELLGSAAPTPHEIHRLIVGLGPSCFITTNYDRLLEISIQSSEIHPPLVLTSRNVVEIPSIVQSDARNFVFKYHGDISDAEGIILTREQYSSLHGEFKNVSKSLELLLSTRPTMIVGFGLRDPDFLAVLEIIRHAFKSQVGEQFAIMPDFTDVEIRYWRDTYNIEVLTYATSLRDDGTRDHSEILDLLRELQPTKSLAADGRQSSDPSTDLMALARLGARMKRLAANSGNAPLPIELAVAEDPRGRIDWRRAPRPEELLSSNESFVLFGHPGAGKSFLLRQYAAEVGSALIDACLSAAADELEDGARLAVYLDLSLYEGSIIQLLKQTLPDPLQVEATLSRYKVDLILDSANEMPEHYIEIGRITSDISHVSDTYKKCRIIVSGRPGGWADDIQLDRYIIEDLSPNFVKDTLSKLLISIYDNPAIVNVLCRPLFFQLASSKSIDISSAKVPSDIHKQVLQNACNSLRVSLSTDANIESHLSSTAFDIMMEGREYFSPEDVRFESEQTSVNNVLEYLTNERFLIAHPGRRLSFFHQSMTEYLAARALADKFRTSDMSVEQVLRSKRWDHALFLSLSLLDEDKCEAAFQKILECDVEAASRALHHGSKNHGKLKGMLLNRIDQTGGEELSDLQVLDNWQLSDNLSNISFDDEHEEKLLSISRHDNIVGARAAIILSKMSSAYRELLIDSVTSGEFSYNYLSSISQELSKDLSRDELSKILSNFERAPSPENIGPIAAGSLARAMRFADLELAIAACASDSPAVDKFVVRILQEAEEPEALNFLTRYLAKGTPGAPFAAGMIARDLRRQEVPYPFNSALAEALVAIANGGGQEARWAAYGITELRSLGAAWLEGFKALEKDMARHLLLAHSLMEVPNAAALRAALAPELAYVVGLDPSRIEIIADSARWEVADAEILTAILDTRCVTLSEGFTTGKWRGGSTPAIDVVGLKSMNWWLDWVAEEFTRKEHFAFASNMLSIISDYEDFGPSVLARISPDDQNTLFQTAIYFLHRIPEFTLTDLPGEQAEMLRNATDLKTPFGQSVLGLLVDERDAENDLLPRLLSSSDESSPVAQGLRAALVVAGRRHNRRYLLG